MISKISESPAFVTFMLFVILKFVILKFALIFLKNSSSIVNNKLNTLNFSLIKHHKVVF